MVKKESGSHEAEHALTFNPMPAEFAAMGKKRIENFVNAQAELLENLQETNRQWFARMQSEVDLASEFASKLTAERSIPDAMTACEEWTTRRFEIMGEDGKHLLADTQKFMQTGAHLFANGGSTKYAGSTV